MIRICACGKLHVKWSQNLIDHKNFRYECVGSDRYVIGEYIYFKDNHYWGTTVLCWYCGLPLEEIV